MITRVLFPIGGNELKSLESVIFREMVKRAGNNRARIVIVPLASAIPAERGGTYRQLFEKFEPASLDILDIGGRPDASRSDYLAIIEKATLVMFGGGDQLRLSSILGGTPLHDLLLARYRQGCVMAGTSAGAAALPAIMIFQNNRFKLYRKGGLEMTQGIGFIKDVAFDTHFVKRARISRLIHTVATNPGLLGIGIEENTGMVIENERIGRCLGAGTVIVVDGRNTVFNDISEVGNGKPFTITGLSYSVLTQGMVFDLQERLALRAKDSPEHVRNLKKASGGNR